MQGYAFTRPRSVLEAVRDAGADTAFLAGGTTLVDLMKLDVMAPARVVDINRLPLRGIAHDRDGLRVGALERMSDVAADPAVRREYPVIAEALELSASAQLRNMASIGGNLLQRTRCGYFRDVTTACNKREPGSGCSALTGVNRIHAILGTSDACVATHPSDLAVALVALGTDVHVASARGTRTVPLDTFYTLPGTTPHVENVLRPGELITGISVPRSPWAAHSTYLKIRDRQSYEFALASAAVALELHRNTIGARRFGWSARRATSRAQVDGQWLIGMGMATAIYPGDRQHDPVHVRVRLLDDDTAIVSSATADLGTGAWTMLAITGADALGIPLHRVKPEIGDTALPPGAPAARSAATSSTVPAVADAADATKKALIQLAVTNPRSPWHGTNTRDLTYEDGRLHGADRSMTFGRLLAIIGVPDVEATAAAAPGPEATQYEFSSFGAHFCEVKVNRFTGEPRVTRFTTVVDIGRVVNAQATRSQIVGGIIFGLGHALLEDNPLEHDTGRLAGSNMADYMVPVNADIPHIDVHLVDKPDPVISAFGARGCGELGTVGSAAAVGNAIYNATGIRVHNLPITLDKLL